MSAPLATIPVGVVVERTKSVSQWSDYLWRPVKVLPGVPVICAAVIRTRHDRSRVGASAAVRH